LKTLLVPVDFSAATRALVEVAISEARRADARVLLLHVAAPEPDFVPYAVGPQTVRDQRAEELREEHGRMHELAAEFQAHGVEAEGRLVAGPTVQTILEQAAEHDAERIVMATHGHGLWHRVLLGSVSEGVLRRARVPVLLVPVRDEQLADA